MTHYKYRWLIALALSIILVALGFICCIQPGLKRLAELRTLEGRLLSQLRAIKALSAPDNAVRASPDRSDEFALLASLVQQQGLFIQSMGYTRPPQLYSAEGELIRLSLQGSFHALTAFLFSLRQQPNMPILDFSFALAEQKNLRLLLDVYVLKKQWLPVKLVRGQKKLALAYNPFCLNGQLLSTGSSATGVSVALNSIKMLGYLQQGSRRTALVLLPNNLVIPVEQGSVLGLEHGLVTSISADHLLIGLPNNKQQEIRM